MWLLEYVKETASFLTAGGVIGGVALKIGKGILDRHLDEKLKPFNKKMEEMEKTRSEQHEETKQEINMIKEELNKNSLNTMKNTICNENIPLGERIKVGQEYIEKGGNGEVKIRVHEYEKEYEEQLKKKSK